VLATAAAPSTSASFFVAMAPTVRRVPSKGRPSPSSGVHATWAEPTCSYSARMPFRYQPTDARASPGSAYAMRASAPSAEASSARTGTASDGKSLSS
jgi:hypothetical protein